MSTELRRLRNYIDGEFRDAADGGTTEVVNPATGEAYATAPLSREADVDATVAEWTRILERWVRKAPEQYFWHHRRWRRQPPDTPPELREPR